MKEIRKDVVVVGGGPSGLAATAKLAELGYDVALVESGDELGGILIQCIHDGFGTKLFGKALSGPEFAGNFIEKVRGLGTDTFLQTHVTSVERRDGHWILEAVSPKEVIKFISKAIVYATGCRERTPFEILVGGTRPAGVYTAGMVQRLVNLYGVLPGKRVLIVGGGDVGMIVARHLYLEGVEDLLVVFPEPWFVGLPRNVQQCILDFGIPFRPRTIVKEIIGKEKVKGAILVKVDENWRPIKGTEEFYPCDSVVFSVGLVPNASKLEELGADIDPRTRGPVVNEYFETTLKGVFAVGNLLTPFDYVDDAVETAFIAAEGVSKFLNNEPKREKPLPIRPGRKVRLYIPHRIEWLQGRDLTLFFRPSVEEANAKISLKLGDQEVYYTRRPYVRPSLLERIVLPRDRIGEKDGEVVLDVE
ncbi:Sarcosine oxidase alpha subunit [Thermofilum adornatum 1505]|uniref:Sarcosine oxidase alpha subunit n=1 Tax=Thermofilum adornatum 1505 TaxID=697581 RepID=A0A3G1A8C5_9CREN|nr:FAD-dependent oxidoreductase [Thermofilum adornatum]AJB41621.1 Sarcosine oxidase alpha subunit [Thermofilum adornatum 1505]